MQKVSMSAQLTVVDEPATMIDTMARRTCVVDEVTRE